MVSVPSASTLMAPVPAPEFEAAIVNVFVPASFAVIVKFELSVPSMEIVEPSTVNAPLLISTAPDVVTSISAAFPTRLMPDDPFKVANPPFALN